MINLVNTIKYSVTTSNLVFLQHPPVAINCTEIVIHFNTRIHVAYIRIEQKDLLL